MSPRRSRPIVRCIDAVAFFVAVFCFLQGAVSTPMPTPAPTPTPTSNISIPTPSPTKAPTLPKSCTSPGYKKKLGINDHTYVCLVVNSVDWSNSTQYSQLVINPKSDRFSRFNIPGSWEGEVGAEDKLLAKYGSQVAFHVESEGVISYQKMFRDTENNRTFNIFTAIVTVDTGEVTGIAWDDGCHYCLGETCDFNTYTYDGLLANTTNGEDCWWSNDDCTGVNGTFAEICQLTVYVVWSGTDKSGNAFTSSSKRLSAFTSSNIGHYIDQGQQAYLSTQID